MFKLVKELFQLLTPGQRKRFYILQILVVVMALGEMVGVASIAPFMTLVGDISILERENLIAQLYVRSEITSPYDFVFLSGIVVLSAITLSTFLSMLTTWRLAMFAAEIGTENADRLYKHYLDQNWLFHADTSSAELVKKVASESVRVTDLVILPLVLMIAKTFLVIFLVFGIVIYNPKIAFIISLTFGVAYYTVYLLVKKRLTKNGQDLSDIASNRFRLMNEGFGGIKEILLLNRKKYFTDKFEKLGKDFAYARGNNHVLWQVPKYFMELLAFGAMITLVLILIVMHNESLGTILPILSIYALAGFKLLPALQQIYASTGQIKGNIAAFEAIRPELMDLRSNFKKDMEQRDAKVSLIPAHDITLSKIQFKYSGKREPVLNCLTVSIPAKKMIGIVGPSGSGKSTFIDLLLGLIDPQQGQLLVDGTPITECNKSVWQKNIGFVPQSVFLSEGSIAENIAFGIPRDLIKIEQVEKVLGLVHLADLVKSLNKGIHTKVGERGVQLSGGQRQRLGIARALYNEPKVLVLDEATSALDGITEGFIMKSIYELNQDKTIIIIAHRLKTIEKCNQIFLLNHGQVVDQGTYNELISKNEIFKRMADHS